MKFVRRPHSLVVTVLVIVAAEAGIVIAHHALESRWLSPLMSIGTALAGVGLFIAFKLAQHRMRKPETLEIGRWGILITREGTAPVSLSWRMISAATLEPGNPQCWRFGLKHGMEVSLSEGDFTRSQWKKFSSELERKLRARKITVTVSPTHIR